ncbi:MAG: D-alanyl-D-alanine carboxypeptidase family protein [Gammaproteobacteria bacterium]
MIKNKFISLALLFTIFCSAISFATTAAAIIPSAPKIPAKAYVLMDFRSGSLLAQQNHDQRIEPASLTKIMTAYAVFHELKNGSIKLEDRVLISEAAWRMKGSRMFIEVNKRVTVKNLLLGMIVQSGNDASVALAEHVAGSEETFAALMNKHADTLGMTGTHFVNSTGWPNKEHYTTATDLAILARAIITDFPEYYKWYSVKEFSYNGITQPNRNKLLWIDERVDGMKTGHTDSAGYCLITSAENKGMRLISIVLGTKSEKLRVSSSRKLLNYGFRFYESHLLYQANEQLTAQRVYKGEVDEIQLGLMEPLYITIPRGQRKKVNATMTIEPNITAPVFKGQQYGTLDVTLGKTKITSRKLVSTTDIPEGGLWSRMVDSFILLFL